MAAEALVVVVVGAGAVVSVVLVEVAGNLPPTGKLNAEVCTGRRAVRSMRCGWVGR